ncbi:MAG: DNA mismatch repair protein MutS [Chitinophagaceae bacterium]|nr:DNA mismatch repair protein MutS [Chitinophagaceae bacterium]
MQLYPNNTLTQLEFEKIKKQLLNYCQTEFAKTRVEELRIHTHIKFIETQINQTHEFKLLLQHQHYFPIQFINNIGKVIKLLSVSGATLSELDFVQLKDLTTNLESIFRWFSDEKKLAFPFLYQIIQTSYYEKNIQVWIDEIIDEAGVVRDNASDDLHKIRLSIFKKRNELRKVFDKVIAKLAKAGYTAEIDESFSNGRRVVAVFSEYKRQVKGILHGESDSRKTAFIEPEETIQLNNDLYSLEGDERKEVLRILKELTQKLSIYAPLLQNYLEIIGEYDFIQAKAKLAIDYNGNLPNIIDKAYVDLKDAYHPLLFLYNKPLNKKTIPLNITLDQQHRIILISGPNAGGKTVAMKTIGLNQLMMQSGLLVPVSATSTMGIFKQIFIQIGDEQSIEFELSTYSSHLISMKYFLEHANGKTLFFIDELGSGSDPNLGGAFAQVILEELCKKHAMGIVTTHYLNLKIMANNTKGIVNAAMAFDEKTLLPLYQLSIGKPGSSYTFSIAERIGLHHSLINRAKSIVNADHFKLDKLLNNTEQNLQQVNSEKKQLQILLKQNEKLKDEMQVLINKEKHKQQVELLQHQNKIAAERLIYLKDMERKLKQIVFDYKKATDKKEVIKNLQNLLFKKDEKVVVNKIAKKVNSKYKELNTSIAVGSLVKLKKNYQVGEVKEIRGKRAIVQIGLLPMNLEIIDLVVVEKISAE